MANEKEVEQLKKELKDMSAEFRKFQDNVKRNMEAPSESRTEGCSWHIKCGCIAWTKI